MRVFNLYQFNIADKVKFKDTQPYLKNMLAELGFSWSDLAFSVTCGRSDTVISKVLEKFPTLKKYYHFQPTNRDDNPTICSYTERWCDGELFADKSDYDDIFTLFSKIPRPFNIPFGHILLNGVNWFGEESAAPIADYLWEDAELSRLSNVHYYSNYIAQHRDFEDGLKYNIISVCIETTAEPKPRNSTAIIEKLIPYLGSPTKSRTECVFSKEEFLKYEELSRSHSKYLKSLAKDALPDPKDYSFATHREPIPHLADGPTLKKAFVGTGFTHKKGNPNWLSEYDSLDSHGHLYKAYIQKITGGYQFRIWLEVSGHNFQFWAIGELDYSMKAEGESLPILREFALLCAKIRDEYGDKLAEDFGDTLDWYNKL